MFANFRFFLEFTAFGRRRFSQRTAGNRRILQKTACPMYLHHPDGVGTDGVVKIFPFNLFFGDVLWKVCAQERYVGPFVSEKKSRLTMKEGLNEVVRPDLSDNFIQR